jgi:hypothetical protein
MSISSVTSINTDAINGACAREKGIRLLGCCRHRLLSIKHYSSLCRASVRYCLLFVAKCAGLGLI